LYVVLLIPYSLPFEPPTPFAILPIPTSPQN